MESICQNLLDCNLLTDIDLHRLSICSTILYKLAFHHILIIYYTIPQKQNIYTYFYNSNLLILSKNDLCIFSNDKNVLLNIIKDLIISNTQSFKFVKQMIKIYGLYLFVNPEDNSLNDYYIYLLSHYLDKINMYDWTNMANLLILIELIMFNINDAQGNKIIDIFTYLNKTLLISDLSKGMAILESEFAFNALYINSSPKYNNLYIYNIISSIFMKINSPPIQYNFPKRYAQKNIKLYYQNIAIFLFILTKLLNVEFIYIINYIDKNYLNIEYKYMIYILFNYFTIDITEHNLLNIKICRELKIHKDFIAYDRYSIANEKQILSYAIIEYFYFVHRISPIVFDSELISKFIKMDIIHEIFILYYNPIDYPGFTFAQFKKELVCINRNSDDICIELCNIRNDEYINLLYGELTLNKLYKKLYKKYVYSILCGILIYMFKYKIYQILEIEKYNNFIQLWFDYAYSKNGQKCKIFTILCLICVDLINDDSGMAIDALNYIYENIIVRYENTINWKKILGVSIYRLFIIKVFETKKLDSLAFPLVIKIIKKIKKDHFEEQITKTITNKMQTIIKNAGYHSLLI
jgi:hypothetical protein